MSHSVDVLTLCYTHREVWLRLPRANATQTQAVQSNYSYFFLFTTKIVTAARQPHFLVLFSNANKIPPIANFNFYSYKILQFYPSSFLCFQL